MKSILIIGSNSFIGQSLIPVLLKSEYQVHALAHKHISNSNHPHLIQHKGGLENNALLSQLLDECSMSFNFACATTPGSSAHHPYLEAKNNLLPTLNFIDALQSHHNHRHIYISSGGAIYGNNNEKATYESDTPNPRSFYGAGKASIELFLHTLHNCEGHDIAILRPSNLYGPGQPLKKSFGLIRTILEYAKLDHTIEVWGDGSTLRDYLYISDFVSACLKIINVENNNKYKIYNLASSSKYSINEIINIIENITGKNLKVVYRPQRKYDIKHVNLDTSSFHNDYNWSSTIPIEQGIELTWKWIHE